MQQEQTPRNPVDAPVQELLTRRWSPYAFDPSRPVASEDLHSLFEAARWTMSSYNEQPWRYIVGVRERDHQTWSQVLDVLVDGNKPWARHAPVLVLGLVKTHFERNGRENKAAAHDLGAASAMLTVEATARGLVVHQMIGIEPDRAREVFAVDESMVPWTALAIGYHGDGSLLDEAYRSRDDRPRERRPLSELIVAGGL